MHKKVILAGMGLAFVGVLSTPFIAGADSGNPWDRVWNAINELRATALSLQNEIYTISLTPGPEGPEGSVGPMGPQGPAGAGGQMILFTRPGPWVTIGAIADALAECNEGETLVGGGYQVSGGGVFILGARIVMIGRPVWMVTGQIPSGPSRDIQAIAHCAKMI